MGRVRIGTRIRDQRKALGITQAELAKRCGISASYLNLIEGDRRNIAGALLKKLADELGAPVERFDGATDRHLIHELEEIAADPLVKLLALDHDAATDLAVRQPAWARAVVSLHRACIDRSEAVAALSDRLTRDPFLGETIQAMLAQITAINSAANALDRSGAVNAAEAQRLIAAIADDSRRLASVSEALTGFFNRTHVTVQPMTPLEEVEDFMVSRDNYFAQLEEAADTLRQEIGLRSMHVDSALIDYLEEVHGVRVHITATPGGAEWASTRRMSHFVEESRTLEMLEFSTEATIRFELARLAAELFAGDLLRGKIEASPMLGSPVAKGAAVGDLSAYLASALLMPYEAFLEAAEMAHYDIAQLSRRFNASFEQVCHRLVTLRRPGAEGVRFAFMRSDPAGHVTKRFPLPGMPLPRYGTGCPLWAVYRAFQTPGVLQRQLVEMPAGERFLQIARTIEKERTDYGMPQHFMSIMLVCEAQHADRLVYSEGLDLSAAARPVPVGQTCRVCVRRYCPSRQTAPIISTTLGNIAGTL